MKKINSQPLPDYLKERCLNPTNRSDLCRKALDELKPDTADTYEFENERECGLFKSTLMAIARERFGRRRVCTARKGSQITIFFNPSFAEGGC